MMLLLDFAVACVDCTGGNKQKKNTDTGSITILTESTSQSINKKISESYLLKLCYVKHPLKLHVTKISCLNKLT